MKIDSEKHRTFSRIEFDRLVNVEFPDHSYEHYQIRNLCISGMFIVGLFKQQIGEQCQVSLVQTGPSSKLTLKAFAKVVRVTDEGIAVEFISMAFDSYMYLQTALLYEVEDPFTIIHELPDKSPFSITDHFQISPLSPVLDKQIREG